MNNPFKVLRADMIIPIDQDPGTIIYMDMGDIAYLEEYDVLIRSTGNGRCSHCCFNPNDTKYEGYCYRISTEQRECCYEEVE